MSTKPSPKLEETTLDNTSHPSRAGKISFPSNSLFRGPLLDGINYSHDFGPSIPHSWPTPRHPSRPFLRRMPVIASGETHIPRLHVMNARDARSNAQASGHARAAAPAIHRVSLKGLRGIERILAQRKLSLHVLTHNDGYQGHESVSWADHHSY